LTRARILIADDHPEFLDAVRSVIETSHEIVGSVSNGQDLFDAARKLRPDVIITDVSMPILNGIEAARKLKECSCTSKVIFLTVHTDHDYVRASISAGAAGYVVKPRMASDLLHAIREALAGRMFISPAIS
jgi:DNA-binding NarL/FixJ family response regulator